jgi:hypothetical protein
MKPHLGRAPPTPEDIDVMTWRYIRGPSPTRVVIAVDAVATPADCRDADLMLQAQYVASFGPCGIELYGIACRGWDQTENGALRTL